MAVTELELESLHGEWNNLVTRLNTMLYHLGAESQQQQAFRRIEQQHPFPLNRKGTVIRVNEPRILKEKTPFKRDIVQIQKYMDLYTRLLKSKGLPKYSKYDYHDSLAKALLLENQHHLEARSSQFLADTTGLIAYLKMKHQIDNPNILSSLKKIAYAFRNGVNEKRELYNKALNSDSVNDPAIQSLLQAGFQRIDVNVQTLASHSRNKLVQLPVPANWKSINDNCVVVNKTTGRVLGVLLKNKIDATTAIVLEEHLKITHASYWTRGQRAHRGHMQDSSAQQASVGMHNLYTSENRLSTASQVYHNTTYGAEIWEVVKILGANLTALYKTVLPKTYADAIETLKELRAMGITVSEDSPFTGATLNRQNPVKAHQDHNLHHYSAMTVLEMGQNPSKAGTGFLEWLDPETGFPVEFIVGPGDVLFADTDYVHIAHKFQQVVNSDRVSVVFYAHKTLATPVILPCADSDIDEDEFEREEKVDDERQMIPAAAANMSAAQLAILYHNFQDNTPLVEREQKEKHDKTPQPTQWKQCPEWQLAPAVAAAAPALTLGDRTADRQIDESHKKQKTTGDEFNANVSMEGGPVGLGPVKENFLLLSQPAIAASSAQYPPKTLAAPQALDTNLDSKKRKHEGM